MPDDDALDSCTGKPFDQNAGRTKYCPLMSGCARVNSPSKTQLAAAPYDFEEYSCTLYVSKR